jgi:hypothetical protein
VFEYQQLQDARYGHVQLGQEETGGQFVGSFQSKQSTGTTIQHQQTATCSFLYRTLTFWNIPDADSVEPGDIAQHLGASWQAPLC